MVQEYMTGDAQVATIRSMSTRFSESRKYTLAAPNSRPEPGGQEAHNDESADRRQQLEQRPGATPRTRHPTTRTTSWGKKCTADTQTDATGNSSRGR